MSKGKPRHNPDKLQNKYDNTCSYYEEYDNGLIHCERGWKEDAETCKGNPHNCIKTLYKRAASRSDKQINNGDFKKR